MQPRTSEPPRLKNGRVSTLQNRNVRIGDHRTSVKLEPELWDALQAIANDWGISRDELVAKIARNAPDVGRTTAIRTFIVTEQRDMIDAMQSAISNFRNAEMAA